MDEGGNEYLDPYTEISQKDGALRVTLRRELAPDKRERAELILGTMLLGLRSVQENYSDYLKIIKKEV